MRTGFDGLAILVAAAYGPQSGSEIQSQIVADTVGYYVRSSNLYYSLHRLVAVGLLEVSDKVYLLTPEGRRRLTLEVQALGELVRIATSRL